MFCLINPLTLQLKYLYFMKNIIITKSEAISIMKAKVANNARNIENHQKKEFYRLFDAVFR